MPICYTFLPRLCYSYDYPILPLLSDSQILWLSRFSDSQNVYGNQILLRHTILDFPVLSSYRGTLYKWLIVPMVVHKGFLYKMWINLPAFVVFIERSSINQRTFKNAHWCPTSRMLVLTVIYKGFLHKIWINLPAFAVLIERFFINQRTFKNAHWRATSRLLVPMVV